MKTKSLTNLCHTLGDAFRRCARRFPVTLGFAFALTAYLCFQVATEGEAGEKKLLMTIGYFLSVGTLLSLSLHLWAEEVKRRKLRLGVQIVAPVLLALDAVFLYHNIEGTRAIDISIAHGAALLAIGLSVFFLPFFRERDDIPAWNFAQTAVGTLALVVIVGAVMSGGLSLLVFSLHQLFGVEVSYKCYLYLLILCSLLLPLLMFLGLLPEGERKHDRQPQPTAFLQGAIRYLFVPLAALYLLVLYAYAGTILVRWELPDGWVSWLVVALMAGVIAIEGGLYPSRIKAHRPTDERIARWLPLLALPLLVLMTVGIGRRFQDYGITLNRLYLVTLNGWFYFVCIGLIVNRARRLSWIPISFSLVFLMTSVLPVNYAGITRSVLHREVEEALTRSGRGLQLPLTDTQYEAWIKSLSPEEGQRINSKLGYLHSWFGQESVKDLVREDVSFHHMAAPEDAPDTEYLNFSPMDGTTLEIPSGHTRLTFIGQSTTLPLAAVLPVALDADTLRLPLDSLRRWEETRQPSLLRTTDGKAFVLTNFHLFIDHPRKEVEAKIEGYVFHND